jgi:hypothetical protein
MLRRARRQRAAATRAFTKTSKNERGKIVFIKRVDFPVE